MFTSQYTSEWEIIELDANCFYHVEKFCKTAWATNMLYKYLLCLLENV